ncbi:TBC domain-containing protein [Reticulomyxa filosa]|uniref:TBC domain-containing protein n=1 Tax=Reticulomyxa filosa TaxID=46433 RepID=X6N298_RETFI|nr:TBC domain-containing protein [Reticulomyxa filosa]|eukprot:ETO20221.1 TBC domain-containing protein [Reticulomyxa filosa]
MLYSNKQGKMFTLSSTDTLQAQIKQWNLVKAHRKVKKRIRKGIPQALRGTVWPNLCGARERQYKAYQEQGSTRIYQDLVEREESPYHDQIWKDINRTYRKQARFGMIGLAKSKTQSRLQTPSRAKVNENSQMNISAIAPPQNTEHNKSLPTVDDEPLSLSPSVTSPTGLQSNVAQLTLQSTLESSHLPNLDSIRQDEQEQVQAHKYEHEREEKKSRKNHAEDDDDEQKKVDDFAYLHRDMIQDTEKIITPSDLEKKFDRRSEAIAFSLYRQDIGYCQGMQSITALMLMYLTEEESFWVLASLADDPKYSMDILWKPLMPGIDLRFYQMERLLRLKMSKLGRHMEKQGAYNPATYQATQWFVTGFLATSMRFECLMRVWDIYFSEGLKSIFRFGLGLLKYHEKELLKSEFEEMTEIFRKTPATVDIEKYIDLSLNKIKVSHSELSTLERQYIRNKKRSEQNSKT